MPIFSKVSLPTLISSTAKPFFFRYSTAAALLSATLVPKITISINTDFENRSVGNYQGATTIAIQDNLYKDKLFWNLAVKVPIQANKSSDSTVNSAPVGYNVWLNYDIVEGFGVKVGGETVQIRENETTLNQQNYYIGIDFSSRADSFNDLMKKIFRKRKLQTLTK